MAYRNKQAQEEQSILFNGISIIVIKKPVKYINLRINREGGVKLSMPMRCSRSTIISFLTEKETWIRKNLERIKGQHINALVTSSIGDTCAYLGTIYPLKFQESYLSPSIYLEENYIGFILKPMASNSDKQQLLNIWYRKQMKTLLPDLIRKWEPIIGVKVAEWGVKAMTTRWGSCNTIKKRIWLNLYLIQKPLVCLEYVLVHEMIHILEPSHNKRFYSLMSQFMPSWKNYKSLLSG